MAAVKSWTASSFLSRSIKTPFCLSNTRSGSCLYFDSLPSLFLPQSSTASTRQRHGYHSVASFSRTIRQPQPLHIDRSIPLINPSNCRSISNASSSGGFGRRAGDGQHPGVKRNPPATFATGGQWEKVDKPAIVDSSPLEPSATKTGGVISARIWDTLKEEISGELEDKENSQANIQMNIKKLEAISKATKRKQAYSPYLWISQLPSAVMPDDIKRMEISEGSITDIIYHRNQYMEFLNRVTVVFRTATDAVEFITQNYRKYLGGHKLVMNMLDPYHPKDISYIPPQLPPEPLSGQLVLVSGLPAASRPDNLRTEFLRFQLMDTTEAAIIPVPSRRTASSCQYLIRLSSRSEAFRFVRTYHNTFFRYKEFRRRCPIRATIIY